MTATTLTANAIFGLGSEWRRDVSAAPVSANSAEVVANLAGQVAAHYGGVASFNVWEYNVPLYLADASTPRYDVAYHDWQGTGSTPPQLYDEAYGAHFRGVPIPPGAYAAAGTDAAIAVYDVAGDKMHELWYVDKAPTNQVVVPPRAAWGGRLDDVSRAAGFYPHSMGTSATGMCLPGGVLYLEEMRRGLIGHALTLQVVEAAASHLYSYPAQRSDGFNPDGVPNRPTEGQRFRMDPTVASFSIGLHPIAALICEAAKTWGFIVTDKSGSVAVVAEDGDVRRRATGGTSNPWDEFMGGKQPYEIMAGFPWHRLQALPLDWGKPAA